MPLQVGLASLLNFDVIPTLRLARSDELEVLIVATAASPFVVLAVISSALLALQPNEVVVEGTYVHPGSGQEFPEQVGAFRREKVRAYGPNDIGIGYNLLSPIRPVAATVYVYPLQEIPFEAELSAIEDAQQNYELDFDRDVELTNGQSSLGCRLAGMSYESVFAGHQMPVNSYLLVCDDPPWRIKWRITHPAMIDGDIDGVMEMLAAPLTVRAQKRVARLECSMDRARYNNRLQRTIDTGLIRCALLAAEPGR